MVLVMVLVVTGDDGVGENGDRDGAGGVGDNGNWDGVHGGAGGEGWGYILWLRLVFLLFLFWLILDFQIPYFHILTSCLTTYFICG